MFNRSGEMKLSSLGLLLILTACLMTLFAQPSSPNKTGASLATVYFGVAK